VHAQLLLYLSVGLGLLLGAGYRQVHGNPAAAAAL
jgi:hypothetical protein